MREMQEKLYFLLQKRLPWGLSLFFFFCMKALKISMLVKNDPARQMSFYLSSFSSRDGVYRFHPWISEAWGLICLLFQRVDYFDVIDHWHFPQGCPYIVHAFHGGQAKGNVIKVLTPSLRWSGVWLLGAGHMVRWHFCMADPEMWAWVNAIRRWSRIFTLHVCVPGLGQPILCTTMGSFCIILRISI